MFYQKGFLLFLILVFWAFAAVFCIPLISSEINLPGDQLGKNELPVKHQRRPPVAFVNSISSNSIMNENDRYKQNRMGSIYNPRDNQALARKTRQIDLSIAADHEENVGTDLTAEAIVNMWKSKDGNTRIDGSASYQKHFGVYSGDGNAKISGKIHLRHDYK